MTCLTSMRVRRPDGTEAEAPVEDVIAEAEEEVEDVETWEAVEGTTTTVEVDGVEIDRLTSATFEKPSGKHIRLTNLDQLYGE